MMEFTLYTALGLTRLLLLVFSIIMPLMIALELFRYYGLLGKLVKIVTPLTRRLGYQPDSVYPLLAGVIFGISYGGGVLIGESRKGNIVGQQAFLIALFLAICHAVVEDTLLFVAQGANWWILISTRLVLATLLTLAGSFMLKRGWL